MNYEVYLNRLVEEIKSKWPVRREQPYQDQIRLHRAFRESDHAILRPSGWNGDTGRTRDYIIDPLGERIPYVWSDLLFGEDPTISPAKRPDLKRMDELIDVNDLPSELQRAEWICSSEGEVWYRVVPDFANTHACIEWHSRMVVTPLWAGKYLMAAAFVSDIMDIADDKRIYRYVEVHTTGHVRRLLFHGTKNSNHIGTEVSLETLPVTADWEADWHHGLDMLAGRIVNRLGADKHMGISDYDGIEDLLLALNEITTIGQENARLTAKQRAILPQQFLDLQGNLPRGAEILVATNVDQDPEKLKNQVAMVEFEFDAAALIAYTEHITDRVLTRARVAPQLVGRHTEGAQTGPALRARVLDSMLAAQGKGKFWDDRAPKVLQSAAQVEKLDTGSGGLGIKWTNVDELPSFKRGSALPEDPEALSRRLAIEVNAKFLSRKTAIAMSHPEWDDSRVEDELALMREETEAAAEMVADEDPQAPGTVPVRSSNAPRPEMGGETGERRDGGVRARN